MTSEVQKKYKISKVDLTDFSGLDDAESISEGGIEALIEEVVAQKEKGWTFTYCNRHPSRPNIVRLYFKK